MADIVSKIKKYISECWTNILIDARDAVVYIDHRAIECLHWYTAGKGYLTLKDAGAVAVYEFGMYHFQVGAELNFQKDGKRREEGGKE